MHFHPSIPGKPQCWEREEIFQRLTNLVNAPRIWLVRPDLSIRYNDRVGSFAWKIHKIIPPITGFSCTVHKLAITDLLRRLRPVVENDQELYDLFLRSVARFPQVDPSIVVKEVPVIVVQQSRPFFSRPAFYFKPLWRNIWSRPSNPPTIAGRVVPGTGRVAPLYRPFVNNIPPTVPVVDRGPFVGRTVQPVVAGRVVPGTEIANPAVRPPVATVVNRVPFIDRAVQQVVDGRVVPGTGRINPPVCPPMVKRVHFEETRVQPGVGRVFPPFQPRVNMSSVFNRGPQTVRLPFGVGDPSTVGMRAPVGVRR
ncbi:MAG: hypothetical protein WCG42_04100 [Parachlamydiaceae bacterium]